MRVFLAIELPSTLAAAIAERIETIRTRLPSARWTPEHNLHLTLHFFGDRAPERIAEVAVALEPVFARHASFTLELAAAGCFSPARPRVAWLGIAPSAELAALHRDLSSTLAATGEEVEDRPFSPHLTLARPKAPWRRRDVDELRGSLLDLAGERFAVNAAVLFESRLGPQGARYIRCVDLALRGCGPATAR